MVTLTASDTFATIENNGEPSPGSPGPGKDGERIGALSRRTGSRLAGIASGDGCLAVAQGGEPVAEDQPSQAALADGYAASA